MFDIETMVVSRRNLLKGIGVGLGASALNAFMPVAALARVNDGYPEFINSHYLDLSPVPDYRSKAQPADLKSLERRRMDAIVDPVERRLIGDIDMDILRLPTDPASLTKIVTFMVVHDFLRSGETLDHEPFTLKTKISNVTLRSGYTLDNSDLTVEDGLKYLMGLSVNQIASSLGKTVAGGEAAFVELMNIKVRQLGLANTAFINASGLPGRSKSDLFRWNDGLSNVTTLEDLAKLTIQAVRLYPEYEKYTTPEYTVSEESRKHRIEDGKQERDDFVSTNPLYGEDFIDQAKKFNVNGLKTGTTNRAGRTLIATGEDNNHKLSIITHGHVLYEKVRGRHVQTSDTERPKRALELLAQNSDLLTFEAQKRAEHDRQIIEEIFGSNVKRSSGIRLG